MPEAADNRGGCVMAWLTTYTDANKVIDGVRSDVEQFTLTVPGIGPIIGHRAYTTTMYRYIGMTYSAAVTAAEAISDASVPASPILATVSRENEAGAYTVNVTAITRGEWSYS